MPVVRLERNHETVPQATEEVVGRSGRPIGALSEAKNSRKINKSGCISLRELQLVRPRRLELPRELPHSDLNAARLPIPPRPHATKRQWARHSGTRLGCEGEKTRRLNFVVRDGSAAV